MDLRARMVADRRLRDSAKALLVADYEFLKGDIERKGISQRIFGRITDSAVEVYDEAVEVAADNKGALAALVAAIFVWFARHPLLAALGLGGEDEADGEDSAEADPERQ